MSQQGNKATDQDLADPQTPEPADSAAAQGDGGTPQAADPAADLVPRAELEQALAKVDENWNLYLGARAETENARKRGERDVANARKYALEKIIGELLPVKDSIELGISAAEDTTDVGKLREGNELTLKMLGAVLQKFGVEPVEPAAGDKFNPELHEAMAMQPAQGVEPNTVLQVVQKGYLLNDRLVRPAMVIVAQAAG